MEILIILGIIFYLSKKKTVGTGAVKVADLPVRTNPKGYFEDDAFTEVYYKLKEDK